MLGVNPREIAEKIKKYFVVKKQFTIENGLMTPTLKLKRYKIIQEYKSKLEKLYIENKKTSY